MDTPHDFPTYPNVTVSFNTQPYLPYVSGTPAHQVRQVLENPRLLKTNISNHVPAAEMEPVLTETIAHFKHAVWRLMIGSFELAEGMAENRTPWRDLIPPTNADLDNYITRKVEVLHEPLCSIWGDAVWLNTETNRYHWLSINKCDETTSAAAILSAVYALVYGLRLGADETPFDIPTMTPADTNATQPTAPPRTSKRVNTDHVKPASAPQPTPQPEPSLDPDGYSESDTPYFLSVPSGEMKKSFGATYGDSVVAFPVRKIKVSHAPDGDMMYELFENSSYNWPFSKSQAKYVKNEATKAYLATFQVGEFQGDWRGVFYVKVKDTGAVYFNLNKLERVLSDGKPPMDSGQAVPKIVPPEGYDIPF